MKVDKGLIIKRISVYGNSFKRAAEYFNELDESKLKDVEKVVLNVLICVKKARLDYLSNLKRTKEVNEAILDTKHDLLNYEWIKENYEEYLRLVNKYCVEE